MKIQLFIQWGDLEGDRRDSSLLGSTHIISCFSLSVLVYACFTVWTKVEFSPPELPHKSSAAFSITAIRKIGSQDKNPWLELGVKIGQAGFSIYLGQVQADFFFVGKSKPEQGLD